MLTEKKIIGLIKVNDPVLEEKVHLNNDELGKSRFPNPSGYKVKAQGIDEIGLKRDQLPEVSCHFEYRKVPYGKESNLFKMEAKASPRPKSLLTGLKVVRNITLVCSMQES